MRSGLASRREGRRTRFGGLSGLQWGEGPTSAVFLHGGLLSARAWDRVLAHMDVCAVALDLPGHGESSRYEDGDYALSRIAADVAECIRGNGWTQLAIVGHSRGGLVASRVAALLGDEVVSLVMVEADPTRIPEEGRAPRMRASGLFDELVDDAQGMRPDLDRERVADGVRRGATEIADGLWAWKWDPRVRAPEDREEAERGARQLAEVTAELTLIRGERSGAVSDEAVARVERMLGRRTHVVTVPSGHNPQSEIPDLLAAVLSKVLAGRTCAP